MSDAFLGEIRLLAFGRVPVGWHACDGSLLPIASNPSLYALIGTTYGGAVPRGQTPTQFGLPDLRGRVPLVAGATLNNLRPTSVPGDTGGSETSYAPLVPHTHQMMANTAQAAIPSPNGKVFAAATAADGTNTYTTVNSGQQVALTNVVRQTGEGMPYPSMQPFTVVQYVICTNGIYPARN